MHSAARRTASHAASHVACPVSPMRHTDQESCAAASLPCQVFAVGQNTEACTAAQLALPLLACMIICLTLSPPAPLRIVLWYHEIRRLNFFFSSLLLLLHPFSAPIVSVKRACRRKDAGLPRCAPGMSEAGCILKALAPARTRHQLLQVSLISISGCTLVHPGLQSAPSHTAPTAAGPNKQIC